MSILTPSERKLLSETAWKVRENAKVRGKTRVGCAAIGNDDIVYSGCNIDSASARMTFTQR